MNNADRVSGAVRNRGTWTSTPTVRIVPSEPQRPALVPSAGSQRLKAKRLEAWTVIALMGASTVLAVFDLYLLSTGLQ
jgi:hypothetical protein